MFSEFLVTVLALLAGLSCGWWWFGAKGDPPRNSLERELDTFTRSAERVMMAISQVHDVASRVAFDVGNHSSDVGRISSELETLRETEAGAVAAPAISVISEMLSVNEKLQQKLSLAEEKLSAQSEEIASQQADSGVDSLTGLPNRRAFDLDLAQRYESWQATKTPFSVAVVDIDGFKEFIETQGQEAADELLRHVARKLHGFTLDKGLVCRFARAEFVVIIPQALTQAAEVALRAQMAIEAMRVAWEGKRLNATISFGLAQTQPGEDAAGLLRRAADALFAANNAGANVGYLHDGKECRPAAKKVELLAKTTPKPIQTPPSQDTELLQTLPNREQLVKELDRRVADSQQYGLPLSLLTIEAPEFEEVLADQGEQAADALLNAVAASLKDTMREVDYLARVAASRFAIILPGSTDAEAKQVAKRIRTAAAGRKVQIGPKAVYASLELGMASYRNEGDENALRRLVEGSLKRQKSPSGLQHQLVG